MAVLENTDWPKLHHAYGRATNTPGHLRALLREDLESRKQAMSHLWSAIIHQGTPWTATGPAALVVAGLLSDERIDRGEPIRADLLSFLVSVAEAPEQAGLSIEELERMAALDIEPFLDSEDDEALYGTEDAASDGPGEGRESAPGTPCSPRPSLIDTCLDLSVPCGAGSSKRRWLWRAPLRPCHPTGAQGAVRYFGSSTNFISSVLPSARMILRLSGLKPSARTVTFTSRSGTS